MSAGMDAMQAGHLVRELKKLRKATEVIAAMMSVLASEANAGKTERELSAMFQVWDEEDGVA